MMRVKHYAQGKFYEIECPAGSTVVHQSHRLDPCGDFLPDLLVVRFRNRDIPAPSEPAELLPLLAEAGRLGLSLVGPPAPDDALAGAACPRCGESDVEWLWLRDDGLAGCDNCGALFDVLGEDPIVPFEAGRDGR